MSIRVTPPALPIRPSDENSKWLSYKLALAYPMLEGDGLVIKNYGFWGEDGNLTVSGATRQRANDGLRSMYFANSSDILASATISRTLSGPWAYAYWVRMGTAPTSGVTETIFALRGPTENHVASWADINGIWSWQKRDIADTYSVLPTSDFSVSKTMLVIASYEGTYLSPAQLRTKQSLSYYPSQPNVYASYNEGTGTAETAITQIFLGNSFGATEGFKGSIGPFYFWDRALSESEIWQLWQDSYAPFRRSQAQTVNPSTLLSTASNSLQGTGKLTGVRPILQDDNSLFINILDYYNYVERPEDQLLTEIDAPNQININDSYSYVAIPTEQLTAPDLIAWPELTITIDDSYAYLVVPSEQLTTPGGESPTEINIADIYSYQTIPTEQLTTPGGESPTEINIADIYSYQAIPTEDITVGIT